MWAGAMQFTRMPRRASSIAIDLLRWITAAFDARVVHHDVKPAELLDGEVDRPLNLVGVDDVGRLEGDGGAELGRQRLATRGVDVGDDDAGTFLDEKLDGRAAETARASRDGRNLSREL